ncbi:hypothetical protein [Histidinibacterium aquaticum]|uniref:Uncharacterized protein n=1 Tax=Histidinibacterium aquaticum TaxID=2613962 RepID=A0A5J5GCR7_9RHOB|nr:hypothetical protein [Histidinibacterium aquaticum]KAA9005966.1 hypothetical protein F3S47_15525 [Histidinibacterium aquaticum]
MFRKMTAFALSGVLATTSLLPSVAAANELTTQNTQREWTQQDTIGAILFGLGALAVVNQLSKDDDDDDDDDDKKKREEARDDRDDRDVQVRPGRGHGRDHANRGHRDQRGRHEGRRFDPYAIPGRCLRNINLADGGSIRLFTRNCLREAGVRVQQLPDVCYRRVEGRQGHTRHGWVPRCLGRQGYYRVDY